jgi:UDP:flavonoid glycosyltransferase YjiC (YdhE family)
MTGAPDQALATAAEQLVGRGQRLVVQGDSAAGVTSPSLVRIGQVDHRALFPRASLVVHHGGAGTTHAVCAAGRASVVVPHIGDQRYWADRLHRLGVAPAPFSVDRLDGAALADAAEATAMDARTRQRAAGLAAAMAGDDGVGTAVAAIEATGNG